METPQTLRFAVPERSPANAKSTTRKRTRFFTLYDYRSLKETVKHVCRKIDFHLPSQTAESWLKQRRSDGYKAFKRPSKQREGPDFAISNRQLDTLPPPTHDPVCKQHSDADRYKGSLAAAELKNRRKKAGMFKCPRVSQSARQMEQSVWTTGKQIETLTQAQKATTL